MNNSPKEDIDYRFIGDYYVIKTVAEFYEDSAAAAAAMRKYFPDLKAANKLDLEQFLKNETEMHQRRIAHKIPCLVKYLEHNLQCLLEGPRLGGSGRMVERTPSLDEYDDVESLREEFIEIFTEAQLRRNLSEMEEDQL